MNTLVENTERMHIVQPRLHLPVMRGVIERRMLVNFRCEPEVLAGMLPAPFRPKLIHGYGMAGICLIRLGEVRPGFLPARMGMKSENAAHRIAVEWDDDGTVREGVFIPRRDTSSRLNQLVGGRLFPGEHHRADYKVWETTERFKVEMRAGDGGTFVRVAARRADTLTAGSIFADLDEASRFFRGGSLGWSVCAKAGEYDGLELHSDEWRVEPLEVERVESSFFSNAKVFPPGALRFDCALLMRDIQHEWRARGRMTWTGGKMP